MRIHGNRIWPRHLTAFRQGYRKATKAIALATDGGKALAVGILEGFNGKVLKPEHMGACLAALDELTKGGGR